MVLHVIDFRAQWNQPALGDLLCTLARRSSNDFHRLAIRYNRQVYPLSGRHTSGIQWLGGPALLMIHSV